MFSAGDKNKIQLAAENQQPKGCKQQAFYLKNAQKRIAMLPKLESCSNAFNSLYMYDKNGCTFYTIPFWPSG